MAVLASESVANPLPARKAAVELPGKTLTVSDMDLAQGGLVVR